MTPDFSTLPVAVVTLVIGLIVLFWHERIAGYFAGRIDPDSGKPSSKLDIILFSASIVIVALSLLWLIRVFIE
jgi:nitrogen fixation-related uncharacterized protein